MVTEWYWDNQSNKSGKYTKFFCVIFIILLMIMNVSCVKMQYFGSRSLHPKRDYSSYLSLLSSYKYTDFKANFLNYFHFHEKFMPYFIGSFTRLWRNFNNCKKKKKKKKPIAKFHNMIFIFILSKIKEN